jgi:hypothetical protein
VSPTTSKGSRPAHPPWPLRTDRLGGTPWDSDLHPTVVANGVAVYEVALLDRLIRDVEERH